MAVEPGKRLRQYGLKSERLLWPTKGPGVFERELGVEDLESMLGLTTVEKAVAWAQGSSIWPDTFGLACCAMEMIAIVSPRYDIARFGAEVFRSSPRQADLLIVSGRVSHKMTAPLRQIYDQMLEPKWVIAMGACASSGGLGGKPKTRPQRFAMVYHLLQLERGAPRVRVKVYLDEGEPVSGVVSVWPTADWHEREAWDMMGIPVEGHPNLSRILMEDDWEGHPLRKDYPIGGEPVRFSGEE